MRTERIADETWVRDFVPGFYRGSVMRFHLPLLYDLVASLRPRTTVCIGFGEGEGALTICQALREQKVAGRCFIIRREENGKELSDEAWEKGRRYAEEFYPAEANCAAGSPIKLAETDDPAEVDLLLIDDCDSAALLREESAAWMRKLSRAAVVLFHGSALERSEPLLVPWAESSRAHTSIVYPEGIGLRMTFVGEPNGLPPVAGRFLEEGTRLIPLYRLAAAKIEAEHQAARLARENAALQTRQTVLDSAREHWWQAQLVMDYQSKELAELQSRFATLLADRKKAQVVMEAQAARIEELSSGRVIGPAADSQQVNRDEGLKRRSTAERIRRELARAWRGLGTPRTEKP